MTHVVVGLSQPAHHTPIACLGYAVPDTAPGAGVRGVRTGMAQPGCHRNVLRMASHRRGGLGHPLLPENNQAPRTADPSQQAAGALRPQEHNRGNHHHT